MQSEASSAEMRVPAGMPPVGGESGSPVDIRDADPLLHTINTSAPVGQTRSIAVPTDGPPSSSPADAPSSPPSPPLPVGTPELWSNARKIYVSYFFAAWGARMWEFAAIVFIMDGLFPSDLTASSLFGLFEALAGMFGSGPAGKLIDNHGRLWVIRTAILVQNICIMISAAILTLALVSGGPSMLLWIRVAALILVIVFGVSAKWGAMLDKMSVNKDWLVVIANGNRDVQSHLNASVRRIDMVCQILAPMGVGLGSAWFGPATTCVLVGLWSFGSVFLELHLATVVYDAIPALALPRSNKPAQQQAPAAATSEGDGGLTPSSAAPPFYAHIATSLRETVAGIAVYYKHDAFWVSIPSAMQYMTVLTFGGIMTSYLKTIGCSDDLLALGRGMAAFVALGPTFIVPISIPRLGLYVTAFYMAWAQVACLLPIAVGFVLGLDKVGVETTTVTTVDQLTGNSITRTTSTMPVTFVVLVFISICLSRFGLWGFDLCQVQIMQELVDKSETGKINGAQGSLNNFFWLLCFGLTIAFANPAVFYVPALASFAMILAAALVYTFKGMRVKVAAEEQQQQQQQ